MYDMKGRQERKNPEAAIASFLKAFGDSSTAHLVVKTMRSEESPESLVRLRAAAGDHQNISIIDRTMTRDEVFALEAAVDCFVSLHRAEGFGLALAECMLLGKPVIATNWSGNVDFMPDDLVACPVNYTLVTLDEDVGLYAAGQVWAEPDVNHAAAQMARLASDREVADRIGAAARRHIETHFSPAVIGQRIRRRLELIARALASSEASSGRERG
jgi:glycosyltransferase involved in cell wall biosynthesis